MHQPPSFPKGTYLLMALITAYMLFFTVAATEITAFIAIALPIAFALAFMRSPALAALIGIPAVFGFFYSNSILTVATVVSVIFAIGMGAAVMLHTKPIIPILMGALAYGAAVIYTKDLLISAYMGLFLLCAVALAVLLSKKVSRVSAILGTSILFLIAIAVPFLISLYQDYGALSADTFSKFLSDLRDVALGAYLEGIEILNEEMRAAMTKELFHSVFDAILSLAPAFLVIAACVVGFFAHMLALSICRRSGYARTFPLQAQVFYMSKVSAIVFIVALVLPILGLGKSDTAHVISVTAENINLMLMPAFLLVGGFGLLALLRKFRGCLNIWVFMALIFFIPSIFAIAIYPLAIFGAIITLRTPSLNTTNP